MLMKKIRKKLLAYYSELMCSLKRNNNVIWLSLGENCLPDDILKRHHKKSYSSLYASGRSNIEYATQMENNNYNHLLDKDNLYFAKVGNDTVVRSSLYNISSQHYSELHLNGFEFTHHNPIDNVDHRLSFERRIKRMIEGKGKQNFVFLYHHRICNNTNLENARKHLKEFQKKYQAGEKKCFIIFFYQTLTKNNEQRQLKLVNSEDNILEFHLITQHIWAGHDKDIFWARVDDDLIGRMITESDNHINKLINL
ncbi:TPA: hypothetical protein L7197_001843, partial [Klebsiella pneumoniae subsp. pneumoniae]|nr:Putative papain-like cysteine peptidase (DUF1796) [Klebsiella pneumoniae]SLW33528.1 Putative papain-like cysteine peptidase (DUF1796) [Klebsiella pneumoniae]HBQ4468207.1 hypothetical protein [Klebsiella pneumoniae subsp. pneumoniae]